MVSSNNQQQQEQSAKMKLHDVWAGNLEEEFSQLRDLIDDYPFVAMDTEFSGILFTPVGQFTNVTTFNYQHFLVNVNLSKLIQVGLTLLNKDGQLPPDKDVWQFNLHFNLGEDMFSPDSIELLRCSGFNFEKHKEQGIELEAFGELLTTSGLLVNRRITWLTFHSCFDFGYLFRAILLDNLPADARDFFRLHRILFPNSFDIKILLKQPGPFTVMLRGSLQEVANQLQVERIGQEHQAGSDSLLTAKIFFKLKERFFADDWDELASKLSGEMYGIRELTPQSLPSTHSKPSEAE